MSDPMVVPDSGTCGVCGHAPETRRVTPWRPTGINPPEVEHVCGCKDDECCACGNDPARTDLRVCGSCALTYDREWATIEALPNDVVDFADDHDLCPECSRVALVVSEIWRGCVVSVVVVPSTGWLKPWGDVVILGLDPKTREFLMRAAAKKMRERAVASVEEDLAGAIQREAERWVALQVQDEEALRDRLREYALLGHGTPLIEGPEPDV